jgi:hypothetical protein
MSLDAIGAGFGRTGTLSLKAALKKPLPKNYPEGKQLE